MSAILTTYRIPQPDLIVSVEEVTDLRFGEHQSNSIGTLDQIDWYRLTGDIDTSVTVTISGPTSQLVITDYDPGPKGSALAHSPMPPSTTGDEPVELTYDFTYDGAVIFISIIGKHGFIDADSPYTIEVS